MTISKQGSMPDCPNLLNEDLYEQFEKTNGNKKNPYNLGEFPTDQLNMIKAGLKWEEGNWSSNDIMLLKKKINVFFCKKTSTLGFCNKL